MQYIKNNIGKKRNLGSDTHYLLKKENVPQKRIIGYLSKSQLKNKELFENYNKEMELHTYLGHKIGKLDYISSEQRNAVQWVICVKEELTNEDYYILLVVNKKKNHSKFLHYLTGFGILTQILLTTIPIATSIIIAVSAIEVSKECFEKHIEQRQGIGIDENQKEYNDEKLSIGKDSSEYADEDCEIINIPESDLLAGPSDSIRFTNNTTNVLNYVYIVTENNTEIYRTGFITPGHEVLWIPYEYLTKGYHELTVYIVFSDTTENVEIPTFSEELLSQYSTTWYPLRITVK